MKSLAALCVAPVLSLLLCGCDGDDSSSSGSGSTVIVTSSGALPPMPDDTAAVEALKKLATSMRQNGDGLIIEVNFRDAEVTDEAMQHLSGLRRVESILFNDTAAITDAALEPIGKLATLRNLDLRGCPVSNAGMAHLKGLKKLKALRLSGKSGATTVDDEGFEHISALNGLKVLAADFLFGDMAAGISRLDGVSNLEELYLAGTTFDDEAAALLTRFPKLRQLRVSQSQLSDQGLEHLAKLKSLTVLDLSENSQIFDGGLQHLSSMRQLTSLNLWRVNITDSGVEHLAGLTNLESLNLDNTQISDSGLQHLSRMTKLKFLHLGSTFISDAGLSQLEPLTSLEELRVTRTGVSEAGVATLSETLTNTKIKLKYIEGE
jgi:Leucine-rich repeat (LRR) protein